jgi:hypothetical protein
VEAGDLLDPQPLVIRPADHLDDRQAAGDARLFLNQRADTDLSLGNEQPAGDIVIADVLALGELDQITKFGFGWEGKHIGSVFSGDSGLSE